MIGRPKGSGRPICRFEADIWFDDDGHFYLKLTGLQYERTNIDGFNNTARRRGLRYLLAEGLVVSTLREAGGLEIWDVSHNIADGLIETITYRTGRRVREPVAAVA